MPKLLLLDDAPNAIFSLRDWRLHQAKPFFLSKLNVFAWIQLGHEAGADLCTQMHGRLVSECRSCTALQGVPGRQEGLGECAMPTTQAISEERAGPLGAGTGEPGPCRGALDGSARFVFCNKWPQTSSRAGGAKSPSNPHGQRMETLHG